MRRPRGARQRAVVWSARRSEPPCFSVIAMPTVTPVLSVARTTLVVAGRGDEMTPFGPARGIVWRRLGTAEKVMPIGQQMPFSLGSTGRIRPRGRHARPGAGCSSRGSAFPARSLGPSARAIGGMKVDCGRPGCRSGRGCAAQAGSGSPAAQAPGHGRSRRSAPLGEAGLRPLRLEGRNDGLAASGPRRRRRSRRGVAGWLSTSCVA